MAAVAQFLNPTITKIELLCNSHLIGVATGFFVKYQSGWAIATNWHVLSGRDPRTGQPRHPSGGVPDICRYYLPTIVGPVVFSRFVDVPLGDVTDGTALWLDHPLHGQLVDVAILPLKTDDVGYAKDLYDPGGHDPEMMVDLGAEIFVPGYPLGLSAPAGFALWKRASLASSLEIGPGTEMYCYIDTATREGMSGAPCLAVSNWRHYRLDRATGHAQVIEQPISHRLLGIYSGRLNASDNFEAQIGIVWREPLLRAVLDGGQTPKLKMNAGSMIDKVELLFKALITSKSQAELEALSATLSSNATGS